MTHIICRASTCLFWEESTCGAEEIEYEPDAGCLTFQDMGDLELADSDEDELEWEDPGTELLDDDEDEWDDEEWGDDWADDDL